MQEALASVERGSKFKVAARMFDIPQSTLADHVHGRILKRKKRPSYCIEPQLEVALEEYICKMQEYEYPLSMEHVLLKVAKMTQE